MITSPNRRCNVKGCNDLALFGPLATHAERCEFHKIPTDVDHVQRACASCCLPWVLNAEGLCSDCSPEGRLAVHAKELMVRAWLEAPDSRVPQTFVHDKRVEDGCSRKRPDFLFDMGGFVVCLEVDEHQHDTYQCAVCEGGAISITPTTARPSQNFITATHACTCEWMRLYTILQDCGGRQLRVVRYNPDGFTVNGSKSRVGATRRRDALLSTLRDTLEKPYQEGDPVLTVQYVCYDGADQNLTSPVCVCEAV